MKKLLSLSLAIVMMLSCLLVQTIAVSAADAVDYTNAPYAGVYAVTSDVATTVTTEIGSVTELAAGETGYMYLIKGANGVEITNGATLTITALEGNGLDYIDEVTIPAEPITPGDTHDSIAAAAGVTLAPGETYTLTHVANQGAGLYYPYIAGTINCTVRVSTDTGYYADILLRGGSSSAWADGSGKSDLEVVYLRDGEQTVTITNTSSSDITLIAFSFGTMFPLADNVDAKMSALKVIPYSTEPEVTPTPTPTEAPVLNTINYTASYAGVYTVVSDKDVTITNETGHTATLVAGESAYFYLIQGENTIETSDETANLTFTELEGNGLDYIGEVTMTEEPILPGDTGDVISGFANVTLDPGAKYTVTYTPDVIDAGLVYPYIAPASGAGNSVRVTTDTGYYADIYLAANYNSSAWADADRKDPEMLYVRDGAQEITIENIGSSSVTLYAVKICTTGVLAEADYWKDQMNMASLKVVPYVEEEPNPTPTPTPTAAPADDIVVYNAELAGVYEVSSDKDVTITNENGSTATLAAGETKYIYLIAGDNNITTTDTAASLTFTRLANNGLDYIDEIETAYICYGEEHVSVDFANDIVDSEGVYSIGTNANGQFIQMAAGTKVTFKVTMAASGKGIIYPYLGFKDDSNENTFRVSSDTGFYADVYKKAGSGSFTWNDADNVDMEFLYMREGVNYITIEVTGSNQATMSSFRISMTGGEDSLVDHATWGPQMNLANLKPLAEEILAGTDATVSGDVLTFCGKIGADYLNLAYGVEFTTNKTGTRAQKYYGARPGDIVGDYNGSTEFTFGGWDGTFEIVLKGVSEGEKEYRFFVGDNYTESATVEVVAE